MATLPKPGAATLADFAKSIDPDGKVAKVVELLEQTNEILRDMQWIEGNLPTGHRTTVRTGLPTNVWRRLYQGVPPSKSTRAQVDETVGMLETRSEVDVDMAKLNGNTAEFRLSEAQAFLESMNQTMATTLFYGNVDVNPERFTGLAPRYNTLNAAEPIADNVLSAGGAATLTSIYLVVWGQNTVHGIFPKGSQAGIQHDDLGIIDAFDENNHRYRAYADHWQWKNGLAVRDWRYVVRICNINIAHLAALSDTQALSAQTNILRLMLRAVHRIPALRLGRPVFYANRTVRQYLDIMAMEKSSTGVLAIKEAAGQFSDTSFNGIPIRTCDAILNTETQVS